jgi:hypothetical protein
MGRDYLQLNRGPGHELGSTLSRRPHEVPDFASEGPLSCVASQSTRTWVRGLKGTGFLGSWFEVLRYSS